MSGKASHKRSTRRSADVDNKEAVIPEVKISQQDTEPTNSTPTEICTNGKPHSEQNDQTEADVPKEIEVVVREEVVIVTRSRSQTPQVKKNEEALAEDKQQIVEENGKEEAKESSEEAKESNEEEVKEATQNGFKEPEANTQEMEPLILEPDEPEPELQFDEASDLESGKDSPVITSRCRTRRSQLRNIPTPKTPKIETPNDTKTSFQSAMTDQESSSSEDLSTKAQPGSDETRLNFTYANNSEVLSPFLAVAKEKTFGESVRLLSARPSVRSVKGQRADMSVYPEREPAVMDALSGVKRKGRSETPEEERKRFKGGILSYISSPIYGFKDRFGGDVASSTPKLTGFKRRDEEGEDEVLNGSVGEKKWCSIM